VAGAGDVDGDGFDDLLIGAGLSDTVAYCAGSAYLMLGAARPADRSLARADATFLGEAYFDKAGFSVAGVGDTDGDGFADMAIGAPTRSPSLAYSGAVYLVRGGASLAGGSLVLADAALAGTADHDQAGLSVAGAGDVDGDGLADFLVGAPWASLPVSRAGGAWLVLGGDLW
jgi:hypothetical protein